MATGSGKTFMACNLAYRLIKHAGAMRILFLVDRTNLGLQTLREFQGFSTPDDGRKFTELYNVQLLQSGHVDHVSKVSIATIQRVYSMHKPESTEGRPWGQPLKKPGHVPSSGVRVRHPVDVV